MGWLSDALGAVFGASSGGGPSIASGIGDLLGGVGSVLDMTKSGGSKDLASQQLQTQQGLQQIALKMAQAGQVNARGDQLVYDQKTNRWVVKPSAATQQLIKASDQAQLASALHDAPLARQEGMRELAARGTASQAADAALNRYRDYNPLTADQLSSDLYTQAARGLKEGYGQTASDVSTQATRAGTGGGQLLDQLSRSYARDLASARVNARLSGLTQANDINTARTNTMLDQYGKLRGTAAGIPSVNVGSDALNAQLSSILSGQAGRAPTTVGGLTGATDQGYKDLINQSTNYYQDLGMSGGSLLSGLGAIFGQKDQSNPDNTGSNSAF